MEFIIQVNNIKPDNQISDFNDSKLNKFKADNLENKGAALNTISAHIDYDFGNSTDILKNEPFDASKSERDFEIEKSINCIKSANTNFKDYEEIDGIGNTVKDMSIESNFSELTDRNLKQNVLFDFNSKIQSDGLIKWLDKERIYSKDIRFYNDVLFNFDQTKNCTKSNLKISNYEKRKCSNSSIDKY